MALSFIFLPAITGLHCDVGCQGLLPFSQQPKAFVPWGLCWSLFFSVLWLFPSSRPSPPKKALSSLFPTPFFLVSTQQKSLKKSLWEDALSPWIYSTQNFSITSLAHTQPLVICLKSLVKFSYLFEWWFCLSPDATGESVPMLHLFWENQIIPSISRN